MRTMLRILAALDLAEPGALKRALTVAVGGLVSTVIVFGSPVLARYGIPVPSDAMQATLVAAVVAKVAAYVTQSGKVAAVEAHAAAVAATPAPTPSEAEASLRAAVEGGK